MIPSGGILRLKNKTDRINNDYLTLVLNSILTKEQANRDVGGSLIPQLATRSGQSNAYSYFVKRKATPNPRESC